MPKNPDINDNHPLAKDIVVLKNKGYSISHIVNHCRGKGHTITPAQIKKYLASQENVELEKSEVEPKKKSGRQPITINFEEFLKRFDIPEKIDDIETAMSVAQKLSYRTLILQYMIVIAKQEAYLNGEMDKFPNEQIARLKTVVEVFSSMWGYDQAIDVNTAYKTLLAQGYKIDAINILDENPPTLGMEGTSEVSD